MQHAAWCKPRDDNLHDDNRGAKMARQRYGDGRTTVRRWQDSATMTQPRCESTGQRRQQRLCNDGAAMTTTATTSTTTTATTTATKLTTKRQQRGRRGNNKNGDATGLATAVRGMATAKAAVLLDTFLPT
ncbi:hypothetical protein EDB86DRAFT_2835524 [Lactarius hatsudake]|nr:hypothetical protein EDB86DRAFT_2835524 [Lactarius hatsudake]